MAPYQKHQGPIGGGGFQKILEVARVIVRADVADFGLGFPAIEALAGHRPGFAVGRFRHARPPAFAGVAHEVAVLGKHLGINFKLRGEVANVIRRVFQLPGVPPRQQNRPRRAALGVRREGVRKPHAVLRHPVEARRVDPPAAGHARMPVRPIIRHRKQNIRPVRRRIGGEDVWCRSNPRKKECSKSGNIS